jgi:uncharacterized OsmC-like protein
MTSEIFYLGNLRTQATHLQSGEQIITDAPIDNHGRGAAFSPTDLLATALGNCMMTIMGIKANELQVDLTGTRISCLKVMESEPRRVSVVELTFELPGAGVTTHQRKTLEAVGRACPVAKSLSSDLEQRIVFNWHD